jgi:hypothetical protein
VRAPNRLLLAAGLEADALVVDRGDARVQPHLDVPLLERPLARLGQLRWIRAEHPIAALEQHHLDLGRIDRAEVVGQRVEADLAERAGQLDARRATADDDERQPLALRDRIRLALGRFVRGEDPLADLEGVVDRLEARRDLVPRVAEVRMRRAGGEDQVVVLEHAVVELDPLRGDVDRRSRSRATRARSSASPARRGSDRRCRSG